MVPCSFYIGLDADLSNQHPNPASPAATTHPPLVTQPTLASLGPKWTNGNKNDVAQCHVRATLSSSIFVCLTQCGCTATKSLQNPQTLTPPTYTFQSSCTATYSSLSQTKRIFSPSALFLDHFITTQPLQSRKTFFTSPTNLMAGSSPRSTRSACRTPQT